MEEIVEKVQQFSEIELAILLSFLAKEHCVFQVEAEHVDRLAEELRRTSKRVFGYDAVVTNCSKSTAIEDFSHDILAHSSSMPSKPSDDQSPDNGPKIPNILIVKHLGQAPNATQMQVLELLQSHRIFTPGGIFTTPRPFICLIVQNIADLPLAKHLNDYIFISQVCDTDWLESGALEEPLAAADLQTNSRDSLSSAEIDALISAKKETAITAEVIAYIHNIVVFLRFHRAVRGGVSPRASVQFQQLALLLAPLNSLKFVTPSVVALAAQKIYAHRLSLVDVPQERSMQYGSDAAAISHIIEGITADAVIEDVLSQVEVPL